MVVDREGIREHLKMLPKVQLEHKLTSLRASLLYEKKNEEYQLEDYIVEGFREDLSYIRTYMQLIKEELKVRGIEYIPTKTELLAEEFNRNLEFIEAIEFDIWPYEFGRKKYVITFIDDITVISYIYNGEEEIIIDFDRLKLFKDGESEMNREACIKALKCAHIGEWEARYVPLEEVYCNGKTYKAGSIMENAKEWSLKVKFSNGYSTFRSSGKYIFPADFWCFSYLLNINVKENI